MSHTIAPSDELRDLYERRAELQYAAVPAQPDPRLDRKFERVCALLAGQLPAQSYLDAGCGDGRYLAAIASWPDRPERVAASDISERILETARAAAGFPVETAQGNLEALPFPDASFDLVLCTQVIEHLLDPARGLRELARVLRPGGHALVTTDNRRARVTQALNLPRTAAVAALGLRRRRELVSFPHSDFTVDEVRGLCTQAGLEVEHLETFRYSLRYPLDWPPAVRALNALERRLPRTGVGDIVAVILRRPD